VSIGPFYHGDLKVGPYKRAKAWVLAMFTSLEQSLQVTRQRHMMTAGLPSATLMEMVLVDALIHHPVLFQELFPRNY